MLKNYKIEGEYEDEGETALEDYTTVIDEDGIPFEGTRKEKDGTVIQHDIPDEYQIFVETFKNLENSNNELFSMMMGSLDDKQQQDLIAISENAKRRADAARSKNIEKAGGYQFNPNQQANFNFS